MELEFEKTRRQHIIDLLQLKSWSVYELAKELDVEVNTVVNDLEHIRKSISLPHKMHIFPPECTNCGFKFKERSKFTKPSRCPRCKGERIIPPMVKIDFIKTTKGAKVKSH